MSALTLTRCRIALAEGQHVEFVKGTFERCIVSHGSGTRLRFLDAALRGVLFLGAAAQGLDDTQMASRLAPVQIQSETLPDWAVFAWLLSPGTIVESIGTLSKISGIVVVDDRKERHSLQFGSAPPPNPNWAEHGKMVFLSAKWFDKHHGVLMGLKREFERVAMEGGDFSKRMAEWRARNPQVIGAGDGKLPPTAQ